MTSKDFNRKFWSEFIELYRQHPALWKTKSEEYKTKKLKEDAYVELTKKMKEEDPNATKDSVKKKINILRVSYRRELKKVLKSQKRGDIDVHSPSLWYYYQMDFLREFSRDVSSDEEGDYDERPAKIRKTAVENDGDSEINMENYLSQLDLLKTVKTEKEEEDRSNAIQLENYVVVESNNFQNAVATSHQEIPQMQVPPLVYTSTPVQPVASQSKVQKTLSQVHQTIPEPQILNTENLEEKIKQNSEREKDNNEYAENIGRAWIRLWRVLC